VLLHRGRHCGGSCRGAEGEQAQTFFLPAVTEGEGVAGLMKAVGPFCPGPVLSGCKTWMVLGWAGLVGAPGRTEWLSARHGGTMLHAVTNGTE